MEDGTLDKNSQVNTTQIFTFDKTEKGERDVKVIGHLNVAEFLLISQYIEHNFR